MKQDREKVKEDIVAEIIRTKGFKMAACINLGLNPRTFQRWMAEDDEFHRAVDDAVSIAREYRDDVAEKKLFDLVESGDTTATIFYCKTRLKHRGYTEKAQQQPQAAPPALPDTAEAEQSTVISRRIKAKKTYIVKLLKKQGKYTPELSMQVKIVAELLVRTDLLAEQIFDGRHQAVNVEFSREGNERESVSPKEKLYLDYLQQSQRALRALGMNTDSKERKPDNDSLNDFISQFTEEADG